MKKLLTLIILVMIIGYGQQYGQALSGTYYIGDPGTKPGGGDPEYATLKAACDDINSKGLSNNVSFYITSNLTENTNVTLGINSEYEILFKPAPTVTPTVTYTQSADNSGISGAFVIGYATSSGVMIPTKNIVIDGSNSDGGTTRDLKFISATGTNAYPFRIRGNCDNITIKNCEITANKSTIAYSIWLNPVLDTGVNYIPDNCTIENCNISSATSNSGTAIHISRSGTTTESMKNTLIKNCMIIAKHRGIHLDGFTENITIEKNTFEVTQTNSGYLSACINGNAIYSTGIVNIFNNDFRKISTVNTSTSYGIRGITASGGGTWYIVNNFFGGFSGGGSLNELTAVRCGSTCVIYNNTIYMNNQTTSGGIYRGIWVAAGNPLIENNIIYNLEDDYVTYNFYGLGTSDFNNLYRNGTLNSKIGYYLADRSTLDDWKNATGQDQNSVSKVVSFASSTDFHLNYYSQGDFDLAGTPIESVTTDIDGNLRNSTYPYMGADENVNISLAPYKRNCDGVANDWTGIPSPTVHASVISNTEAIYTGESGDCRTDQHGGDINGDYNNDLTEVRYTRDENFIYFLFKFRDIIDINRPYIAITIDKDRTDDSPVWIGDDSPVTLNPSTNRGWERQVAIHATTNRSFYPELFADDGSEWYGPLSNYSVGYDEDNNIIEVRLALYDLNIDSNSDVTFTFATFNNVVGYNNAVNTTTASYLDAVTPGYAGTSNAYFRVGGNTIAAEYNENFNTNVNWQQVLTPLPVELTSFQASYNENLVTLTWQTATEINSYCFEVERSNDNTTWDKIGSVNAGGNSNKVLNYEYFDNITTDGKYYYRLKQIDLDGSFKYTSVVEVNAVMPMLYSLSQNYPNPFNPTTKINYSIPVNAKVTLNIYSITGELVITLVDEDLTAGNYTIDFDASKLASGTYFYRIIANDFIQTKKMLLIK